MDPLADPYEPRDYFGRKQPSPQDEAVSFIRSTFAHGLTGLTSLLRESRSVTNATALPACKEYYRDEQE
jgi:hypothetical protein